MSNPSVTATISANDLASPKLRELIATLKQAERVAKEAFNGEGMGGKYVNGINQATAAAQRHVGVLHQIHAAHKAIAGTVAGYASLKMAHGGIDAIKHALPYLREDRAIQARTGYSDSDMTLLRKQQNELAAAFGSKVEATQKAHETFGRLKYDAATNVAITGPTAVGARAMGVTTEQNAELMESMISQFGVHFDSPADAQRKAKHLNDIAAVATKKSNMKFEDVLDYTRYSAAAASAVNVSPEQSIAMGMALRRGGIVGSEGGVFARQFYARMMAPTRKGREIAAQYGINLDEYAGHGTITGEGLSDKLSRSFGKGLSKATIEAFNKDLEENGGELLSDRGKFAEAVVKARSTDGEKLSETDRKHLVKSANEYFDWTKTGIRGGALLDRFMEVNNPMLMQGYLGDKQGARGVALLKEREQYFAAKEDQAHADGFSQKVSDEMNKGLAAATDRLAASFDALQNTVVKANEGWITPLVNATSTVISSFNNLSPQVQQATGIFAGLATVAAGGYAAFTFASFLKSLNSLSVSAVEASAALKILAAGSAIPGVPGSTAKNAARHLGVRGAGAALGGVLAGPVGLIVGMEAAEFAWPYVEKWATEDDVIPGSVEDIQRRRRFGTVSWGRPSDSYIRKAMLGPETSKNLADTEPGKGGWMDSAIVGIKPSQGWGDGRISSPAEVHGTVTGEAELHQTMQIEVKPTAYFESLVKRAEAVSNMHLNGQLGTGLQGPGDNSVKPSQAPTGTQE